VIVNLNQHERFEYHGGELNEYEYKLTNQNASTAGRASGPRTDA
jgi:hypothetical protein